MSNTAGFRVFEGVAVPCLLFMAKPTLVASFMGGVGGFGIVCLLARSICAAAGRTVTDSRTGRISLLIA